MTNKRPVQLLVGVSSLVTALTLLAGVPLLLVITVGWPLPTSIPNLAALEQAARSGVDDQVVINTLAVVAWIVWAQLALAFVLETVTAIRGRPAPHALFLPGFRMTAARLVTGILMLASTVQPARAFAAPVTSPVGRTTEVAFRQTSAQSRTPNPIEASSLDAQQLQRPAATGAQQRTVTVQRHDSLWAIAERHLSDGRRWKEILDLNVGRALPDGTTITATDDTPPTGTVLLLPADTGQNTTDHATPPPTVGTTGEASTITVQPGDNLWTISESRLGIDLGREPTDAEVAPYWDEVIDANRDHFIQPGNPNLIHPGQTIVLPATGHAAPAATPANVSDEGIPPIEVPEPSPPRPAPEHQDQRDRPDELPATTATSAAPGQPAAPDAADEPRASPTHGPDTGDGRSSNGTTAPIAVGGLASIVLAVGLKRLLRRRQRAAAVLREGRRTRDAPPDLRKLHHAVIAQADDELVDDLHSILAWLATSLAEAASPRRPRIIRHSAESLEVLLDHPDPSPPAGWTTSDDGTIWTLEVPPHPDDLPDELLSPAPLLVTIGQPDDDDAQLYLDLEADALLALTGDPTIAGNLARSIVTELAVSPIADTLRVIAIGDVVDDGVEALERVTVVDSWDDIADDIETWASQSHDELVENDWTNTFVARAHEPDNDALVPVVVIADQPPPEELLEVLLANLPSAATVVVVGDLHGATATVHCEPDILTFGGLDIACLPQAVAELELEAMCRLVAAVDDPEDQPIDDPSPDDDQDLADASQFVTAEERPSCDILVRLLGCITVEGGKALKAKATSVVAYLALHRSVTTERLEEACWYGSEGTSTRKRLRNVMTEARDALGSQHLPVNRDGMYAAGSRLRTDIELFDWHVQRSAALDPSEAVEHLRAALDLVTDRPFTYPNVARNSYGWVDVEHLATTWEYRAAQVASRYAELQIAADKFDEAINQLRRFVRAIPLNGTVVEALMRVHVAAGDRAGAEHVFQEHAAALSHANLGDPEESLEALRRTGSTVVEGASG